MKTETQNQINEIISDHEPQALYKALNTISAICQNYENDLHHLTGSVDYLRGMHFIREIMSAIVERELITN